MLKIAFQGVRGAYSEVAVNKLFSEGKADVIPMHSFEDVFKGIESGDVTPQTMTVLKIARYFESVGYEIGK